MMEYESNKDLLCGYQPHAAMWQPVTQIRLLKMVLLQLFAIKNIFFHSRAFSSIFLRDSLLKTRPVTSLCEYRKASGKRVKTVTVAEWQREV